jgi:hypothetical protein
MTTAKKNANGLRVAAMGLSLNEFGPDAKLFGEHQPSILFSLTNSAKKHNRNTVSSTFVRAHYQLDAQHQVSDIYRETPSAPTPVPPSTHHPATPRDTAAMSVTSPDAYSYSKATTTP